MSKTSWSGSGRKGSCRFSFGFWNDWAREPNGGTFLTCGQVWSGTRQSQPTTYSQATCPVWQGNNFQSLTDWTWTGTRSESIYCSLSFPPLRLPVSHLPCSLFRKGLSSNSLSKQITLRFLILCHILDLLFQKEQHSKFLTRTLVIKALSIF